MTKEENIIMEWINIEDGLPSHKELVLVDNGVGIALPAIYYNNQSFKGFYKFTDDYHNYKSEHYKKVYLKSKHEIKNILKWMYMPIV